MADTAQPPPPHDVIREDAAKRIQKSYRGYRTRRELRGFALTRASTRWVEAVKEAQWRQLHRPADAATESKYKRDINDPNHEKDNNKENDNDKNTGNTSSQDAQTRRNWQRAVSVAIRAGGDDRPITPSNQYPKPDTHSPPSQSPPSQHLSPNNAKSQPNTSSRTPSPARSPHSHTSAVVTAQHDLPRDIPAKTMDLQYFLEMVDLKHRHGSNLRVYHSHWKALPTRQNFFFWLDYGEGRELDLPACPRQRLDTQQVRYVSREERENYRVVVDEGGKLRWAKNGEVVWTDSRRFKDSLGGVVPVEEDAPVFRGNSASVGGRGSGSGSGSGSLSSESESSVSSSGGKSDGGHYEKTSEEKKRNRMEKDEYEATKVVKKLMHANPSAMFEKVTGKSLKKEDMWIFVADTSFRIYIGIKEAGAFQHSSFLRGARIAAAGMIKVRKGQLRSLAPLSGHYRPPPANFRAFIHALQDQGVDMSRISVSKSYAILAGVEGYTRTRQRLRDLQGKMRRGESPEDTSER